MFYACRGEGEEVNCADENVNGIFETTVEWRKHEISNRMLVEGRQRVYPRS